MQQQSISKFFKAKRSAPLPPPNSPGVLLHSPHHQKSKQQHPPSHPPSALASPGGGGKGAAASGGKGKRPRAGGPGAAEEEAAGIGGAKRRLDSGMADADDDDDVVVLLSSDDDDENNEQKQEQPSGAVRTMDFAPSEQRQQRFIKKLAKASVDSSVEDGGATDDNKDGSNNPMRGRLNLDHAPVPSTGPGNGAKGKKGAAAAGAAPAAAAVKYTPLEQQVLALKKSRPDALLMVECGYRLRFFGEDALQAAKVLGIFAYLDHNFYVASVPTVRVKVHLRRLLEAGHKVALARQTETAALKAAGLSSSGLKSGTFQRGIVGVFTRTTYNPDDPALAFVNQMVSRKPAAAAAGPQEGKGKKGGGSGAGAGGGFYKKGGAEEEDGEEEEEEGVGGEGDEEEEDDDGDGGEGLLEGEDEGEGGGSGGGLAVAGDGEGEGGTAGGAAAPAAVAAGLMLGAREGEGEQWMMGVFETRGQEEEAANEEEEGMVVVDDDEEDEVGGGSVPNVRVAVLAVNTQTGGIVYDVFTDGPQRMELDTRLRQLQPLELLLPCNPSLSKESEACIATYAREQQQGSSSAASQQQPHPQQQPHQRVIRVERRPAASFALAAARAVIAAHHAKFSSTSPSKATNPTPETETVDALLPPACLRVLGPLLEHASAFGMERLLLARPAVRAFRGEAGRHFTLDGVTLRDLEIFASQPEGREYGSLLWLLDNTATSFGRRRLREWVRKPLARLEDINARLTAVEELAFSLPPCLERTVDALLRRHKRGGRARHALPDLESMITTLHYRRLSPRRLVTLLQTVQQSLHALPSPAEAGAEVRSELLRVELARVPAASLQREAGALLALVDPRAAEAEDKANLFTDPAFHPGLTERKRALAEVERGLEEELEAARVRLRRPQLQYRTLRTGVNSSLEYLIELPKKDLQTKSLAQLLPPEWVLVSSTKDANRYHTPRVLALLRKLLVAREEVALAGEEAWRLLVATCDERCYPDLRTLLSVLSTLDALLSLAHVARRPGYCKPEFSAQAEDGDGGEIVVMGGRHPVLEQVMAAGGGGGGGGGGFVPNDVKLGVGLRAPGQCQVVTGPNMGGKSTYIRMVALLCIMGHLGSYVPAEAARLCLLDGVYTRMGAGDDLAAGMSTFLVELWNTSFILHKATSRSLVILDELGRGTATYDGMALAEATVKHLVTRVGCPALFVTHYPQLSELAADPSLVCGGGDGRAKVKAGHMAFIEGEEGGEGAAYDMAFLYQLREEGATRSYGLNVARMAGMDAELLALAGVKSRELEVRFERLTTAPSAPPGGVDVADTAAAGMDVEEEEEEEGEEDDDAEEQQQEQERARAWASRAAALAEEVRAALAELAAVEESGTLSLRDYNRKRREILGRVVGVQAAARAEGFGSGGGEGK